MLLKFSPTVILVPSNGSALCYDYLNKTSYECDTEVLYWLCQFSDWTSVDDVVGKHKKSDPQALTATLQQLHAMGLLVSENDCALSPKLSAAINWQLGPAAAIFHYTCLNTEYVSLEESKARQLAKLADGPVPELTQRLRLVSDQLAPLDSKSSIDELLILMAKRRTVRQVKKASISREELIDLLFAGLGIVGYTTASVVKLPMSMTPSGGARNPFEAYVMVRNVEHVDRGVYHFSAVDATLEKIAPLPNAPNRTFLSNQDWADGMPAVIFLVGLLERSGWKYPHPNAYRCILIEAGHIGQNIMLAATAHGLTACPTAALASDRLSKALRLNDPNHTPIYALAVGRPTEKPDPVHPNPTLQSGRFSHIPAATQGILLQ